MQIKPLLLIYLCTVTSVAFANHSTDIDAFNHSWVGRALTLQRTIDEDAPLNEATFLGTHNSYNSSSYEIPFIRYVDPNQSLSIKEQLALGIRSIEFDAHWTLTKHAKKDILLCHAHANHLGCSMFDRTFAEGLQELRDWLKANPNEIVLLYIERHLDNHEAKLAALLEDEVGNYVFKPGLLRSKQDKINTCMSLPTNLSKRDILRTGKQLVIVTKNCDDAKTNDVMTEWNNEVFAGMGKLDHEPFTFLDSTVTGFTPFPDCSKSNVFKDDVTHRSLWRIFEDRTHLTNIERHEKKIEAEDVTHLLQCNINLPTFDMLTIDDVRLTKAIWSWAENFPKDDAGNCSFYEKNVGIENTNCDRTLASVACANNNTREFKAVPMFGAFANGENICQLLAGKDWHFMTPVNRKELDELKESMNELLVEKGWINYQKIGGEWVANGVVQTSS